MGLFSTMKTKYIFITGGVSSSLGKGIAASTIGTLMEAHGYKIGILKIDPYINIDAGTMSPLEHGEVYVTQDGGETDLDLGNYERFTHHITQKRDSITTGKIYQSVIENERKGTYLGKCIQLIPHITDEIKRCIKNASSRDTDILLIEIGGTVGDIESTPFLEAARQFLHDFKKEDVAFVHTTLVPFLHKAKELKTKPTQHSVQKLREIGIQPDILLCRTEKPLPSLLKEKLSLFTQIATDSVIEALDCPHSIYEVPIQYYAQGLSKALLKKLSLPLKEADITHWKALSDKIAYLKKEVEVALVGKYVTLKDADLSVREALIHAGFAHDVKVKIRAVESEYFSEEKLHGIDGILVPGGFGNRGIDGMIAAAHYAYQHKIPYLGICLGMQVMVIAQARHALGLREANSTEFVPNTPYPVVHLLEDQAHIANKGGTMRLGAYTSQVKEGSKMAEAYGKTTISERHRHRYEVNHNYLQRLEESGMMVACTTNDYLVEGVEWKDHPFGIGVQYHPEFQSKPLKPHPLFKAFIGELTS